MFGLAYVQVNLPIHYFTLPFKILKGKIASVAYFFCFKIWIIEILKQMNAPM